MSAVARFRERITPAPADNRTVKGVLKEIYYPPESIRGTVRQSITLYTVTDDTAIGFERCWDEVHPGPPYLTGGPFLSVKATLPHHTILGKGVYNGNAHQLNANDWAYWSYTGGFGDPYFGLTDSIALDEYVNAGKVLTNASLYPTLTPLASEAYNRLRPEIEHGGLGLALAEAREIPRMMKTTAEGFHTMWKSVGGNPSSSYKRMRPKKAADHYLNTQFGWVPFLGDFAKFYDVYLNSGKYIRQLTKDNNTWVRRHRSDKKIESETVLATTPQRRCNPSDLGVEFGELFHPTTASQLILRESTMVWYEGSFKYYRPEFDGSKDWYNTSYGDIHRHLTLLGARINPSLIYNATPWTWLVDWFTNVGDTVQRASDSATDSIVSKYMYLMHHKIRELVVKVQLYPRHSGVVNVEWSRKFDIKRRVSADSPYGFSLSPDALSGRQLSILGALGLSRTH